VTAVAAHAAADPPAEVDEAHARRTLGLAGLAVLVTFLDTTVLFVAFPDITASFPAASASSLSWVLNAYTIAFAALLIPAGKLADRVGHKRMFLVGSLLFTVASLACAVAPTVAVLVAFRVVQAVGAALLVPSSMALVLRAVAPEKVPVALAIWGAMGAAAGAVGPTLGALLVEAASWRWVFVINLPAGILTVVAGRRHLRESADPETRVPALLGAVLIAAAAALVSLAVVNGDEWGWVDARTLGAAALGLVSLALFVAHQARTPAPALDLSLLRIRNFAWVNATTFVFGVGFTAMFFGSFLFLTEVWRWSVLKAGLGISPGPLLVAVLAPQMGRLAGRIGQRPLLVAGGISFAAAGVIRSFVLGPEPDYLVDYLPTMLLTGLAVALCFPQMSSVTAQSLPPNRLGVGGAVNQAVRQLGGTIGVALTIALIATPLSLTDAVDHFGRVWLVLVVSGVLTSLCALPLRTRRS
jgi:EmrB/QacA subfamily drug resistance transporter